jgi:hypothetical protein
MPDLKEQLTRLGEIGEPRGAASVWQAAASSRGAHSTGLVPDDRIRRRLLQAVAAAVVIACAAASLVWLRADDDADRHVKISPAGPELQDLYDTSGQAPLGSPTYLVPTYVPEGMTPYRVQGGDDPGRIASRGGSTEVKRAQLWVKFDPAGTRPAEQFIVQWGPGAVALAESPFTETRPELVTDDPLASLRFQSVPDHVGVRGALYVEHLHGIAWEQPAGQMVMVSADSLTRDEVRTIAEGLEPSPTGDFRVTNAPLGYALVSDAPGMGSLGTNEREVTFRSSDDRGFRVAITDDMQQPPGLNLVDGPGSFGRRDVRLVEVRGQLGIATNELVSRSYDAGVQFLVRADQFVQWLEPGNVLVTMESKGLTAEELLEVARGLHVVDRDGWTELAAQASTT